MFVGIIIEYPVIYILVAIYAVVGWLWLTGAYWDQLQGGFSATSSKRLPYAMLLTVSLLFVGLALSVGWIVSQSASTTALAGFMPSSGGTQWHDVFARMGMTDGDAMVGGKDHADSVGPVESELFLADDKPSLFDVASELYGEPIKNKSRAERAIALSTEKTLENEHAARNKKQGQESTPVLEGRAFGRAALSCWPNAVTFAPGYI
jgi:hypothetical protein